MAEPTAAAPAPVPSPASAPAPRPPRRGVARVVFSAVGAALVWLAAVPTLAALVPLEVSPSVARTVQQALVLAAGSLAATAVLAAAVTAAVRSRGAAIGATAAALFTLGWSALGFVLARMASPGAGGEIFGGYSPGAVGEAAANVRLTVDAAVCLGGVAGAWAGQRIARRLIHS